MQSNGNHVVSGIDAVDWSRFCRAARIQGSDSVQLRRIWFSCDQILGSLRRMH